MSEHPRAIDLRELVQALERGPTKPPKPKAEQEKGKGDSHQVAYGSYQREHEPTLRELLEAFERGPSSRKLKHPQRSLRTGQDTKDSSNQVTYSSSCRA